jgi:hypothetical protein
MARSGSEPHNVRLLRAVLVEHILYPERAAGINQPDSLEAPRYAASTTLVARTSSGTPSAIMRP